MKWLNCNLQYITFPTLNARFEIVAFSRQQSKHFNLRMTFVIVQLHKIVGTYQVVTVLNSIYLYFIYCKVFFQSHQLMRVHFLHTINLNKTSAIKIYCHLHCTRVGKCRSVMNTRKCMRLLYYPRVIFYITFNRVTLEL